MRIRAWFCVNSQSPRHFYKFPRNNLETDNVGAASAAYDPGISHQRGRPAALLRIQLLANVAEKAADAAWATGRWKTPFYLCLQQCLPHGGWRSLNRQQVDGTEYCQAPGNTNADHSRGSAQSWMQLLNPQMMMKARNSRFSSSGS